MNLINTISSLKNNGESFGNNKNIYSDNISAASYVNLEERVNDALENLARTVVFQNKLSDLSQEAKEIGKTISKDLYIQAANDASVDSKEKACQILQSSLGADYHNKSQISQEFLVPIYKRTLSAFNKVFSKGFGKEVVGRTRTALKSYSTKKDTMYMRVAKNAQALKGGKGKVNIKLSKRLENLKHNYSQLSGSLKNSKVNERALDAAIVGGSAITGFGMLAGAGVLTVKLTSKPIISYRDSELIREKFYKTAKAIDVIYKSTDANKLAKSLQSFEDIGLYVTQHEDGSLSARFEPMMPQAYKAKLAKELGWDESGLKATITHLEKMEETQKKYYAPVESLSDDNDLGVLKIKISTQLIDYADRIYDKLSTVVNKISEIKDDD